MADGIGRQKRKILYTNIVGIGLIGGMGAFPDGIMARVVFILPMKDGLLKIVNMAEPISWDIFGSPIPLPTA